MNKPKFRAKETATGETFEVGFIDFIKKMVCVVENEKRKICKWLYFDEITLMQFVRKDKNGIEAYEGQTARIYYRDHEKQGEYYDVVIAFDKELAKWNISGDIDFEVIENE